MNFKRFFVASLLTVAASGFYTQARDAETEWEKSPMTQAVMKSYSDMLTANPKDYLVYFRRAGEYYNHNIYSKALADIDNAIKYTPQKEKDILFQCYALRASIYEQMEMSKEAIADLNSALSIDPDSYTTRYQLANLEFETGDYAAAKADYQKLQRLNSRSQEALIGLARIAHTEGNSSQADNYLDDAVALNPSSPDSYTRRASVRRLMGNNAGAVDDYVSALLIAKGSNISRPLRELVEMSDADYTTVMKGLTDAINRSSLDGSLYYIRGVIAQSHFKYPQALADFNFIERNNLLDTPSIYAAMAECYYALGAYEEAVKNIDIAIGSTSRNIDYYVVKSDIKRAQKLYRGAIAAADRALSQDDDFAPALAAKGVAEIEFKLVTEGSTDLGKAVIAVRGDAYYNMLRAWALKDFDNLPAKADEYYDIVATLSDYAPTDVRSFRGFALLYTNHAAEGDAWMESVLKAAEASVDGEAEYYGACYYSARGMNDKALECMELSLKKGYANYHNWTANDEARINVAPLRTLAQFNQLLETYKSIFAME